MIIILDGNLCIIYNDNDDNDNDDGNDDDWWWWWSHYRLQAIADDKKAMKDGYSPIVVKNKGDTRWIQVYDDHLERMLKDFYEYQVDIAMGKW